MNPRPFFALLVLTCAALSRPAAVAADRPSVLMIVVNDFNGWIGCRGGHPSAIAASSAAPAPGSAHRTLVRDGKIWRWEGEPIRPEERIQ